MFPKPLVGGGVAVLRLGKRDGGGIEVEVGETGLVMLPSDGGAG